jgi:hypothetical protein
MNSATMFSRIKFGNDIAEGRIPAVPIKAWPVWNSLAGAPLNAQAEGVVGGILGGFAEPLTHTTMLGIRSTVAARPRAPMENAGYGSCSQSRSRLRSSSVGEVRAWRRRIPHGTLISLLGMDDMSDPDPAAERVALEWLALTDRGDVPFQLACGGESIPARGPRRGVGSLVGRRARPTRGSPIPSRRERQSGARAAWRARRRLCRHPIQHGVRPQAHCP